MALGESHETRTEEITTSTLEEFDSKAVEFRTRLLSDGWEIVLDVDVTHIQDDDGTHRGIIRAIRYPN